MFNTTVIDLKSNIGMLRELVDRKRTEANEEKKNVLGQKSFLQLEGVLQQLEQQLQTKQGLTADTSHSQLLSSTEHLKDDGKDSFFVKQE